jgi:hypothetical protein
MSGAAVLLGNVDYRRHMTTEGDQFQTGLQAAGWIVAGKGFDDLVDVPTILERYRPDRVVVHDPRDWDPGSPIAFRKDVGFARVAALANRAGCCRAVVVKDAASSLLYQKGFYRLIQADAAIVYYHPRSIRRNAEWLADVPLIRTYHSVDADDLGLVGLSADRRAVVVSGALSMAYPLRQRVVRDARILGVEILWHPGYGNRGARTPIYCRQLAGYKVAIATASMYGFALRKIIEAVAVGCTVITDLPAYDELPAIDGALVRVPPTINPAELAAVIARAVSEWNLTEREGWARAARTFYDYRALGVRLDGALAAFANGHTAECPCT